jgi:hypothetical protein
MRGAGAGTLNAIGNSDTEVKERHRITDEAIAVKQKQNLETVDHLGIEDAKK